jgi:hypothetical protein
MCVVGRGCSRASGSFLSLPQGRAGGQVAGLIKCGVILLHLEETWVFCRGSHGQMN